MNELSRSPDRNFQEQAYLKRKEAEGKEIDPDMLELFQSVRLRRFQNEQNPEWQKLNLEYDLRTCDWILEKVRTSNVYAQHLYAALCNMQFVNKEHPWDKPWSCSWRYAGGIIADMQMKGDYIDWYCSGIRGDMERPTVEQILAWTPEQEQFYYEMLDSVPEGMVTKEIREDLNKLGWEPREWEEDEDSN